MELFSIKIRCTFQLVSTNIGEVARSDGGVEKTDNSSDKVKPPLSLPCPVTLRGVSARKFILSPLFFNDKLYFLCP